jgi:hypothetical protein
LPSPPKGYLDEANGQIHQCWGGEAGIGTTPVVNVGPDGRLLEV